MARRLLILPLFAGLLEHEDGLILKALQKAPRGTRELHFYEKIFHKDCTDKHILELQQFLPQFFGAFHFEEYPEGGYNGQLSKNNLRKIAIIFLPIS